MRAIVLMLTIVLGFVMSGFWFVPSASRTLKTAPIKTKYHYDEGGALLPEYDGFIDAPIEPSPATRPRD